MSSGRLAGIARHDRPRGPIETVNEVAVTLREGVHGDYRGAMKPEGSRKRQISLITAEGWAAALSDLELEPGAIPWWQRRVNLLAQGITLPQRAGAHIHVGETLVIEVAQECNPCSRMEEIHPGLKAALTPDWRGGVLGSVLVEGTIRVGDTIRIEE